MNFDDRLRDQLEAQSSGLHVEPEGPDAIRARSRRRAQRRVGATAMAAFVVVLAAGAWIAGRPDSEAANLATDGEAASIEEVAQQDASAGTAQAQPPASDIETALPEPGDPLVLSPVDTANAPGGYNVRPGGQTNGLYYVLSTAPGVTWENAGDDLIRNDTIYTFDGSTWSQNPTGDRFISTLDSDSSGLLYTVSTGSPTSRRLELGTSANAGRDWAWTELDLTPVFGPDQDRWPDYLVQRATRGSETLVIVHAGPQIDIAEAESVALANGAAIDPNASDVAYADANGIGWYDTQDAESDPCQAAMSDALERLWSAEPEGPEFDYEDDLTPEQQAELEQFWAAQETRAGEITAEALDAVARVPGCSAFVKCTTQFDELSRDLQTAADDFHTALGPDALGADPGDEVIEQIDEFYAGQDAQIEEWVESSGCGETLPWLVDEVVDGVTDVSSGYTHITWAELGVEVPDDWKPTTAGFLVDGDGVTELGTLFDGESGYLAAVRSVGSEWSVTFDSATYEEGEGSTGPSFNVWTSPNGSSWSASPSSAFDWSEPASLANGMSFQLNYRNARTELIRTSPNGAEVALTLDDLGSGADLGDYSLMNVRAGDYGVVAWAVRWQDAGDSESAYDSFVFYSPDGVAWGVTEVPDVEVVEVIVGSNDVMLFLNDPARADGAPQPISVGTA